MTHFRNHLPQLQQGLFLTDGGCETTLIFHNKIDLPYFAAFDLMKTETGRAALRAYYERYINIALSLRLGFILESPTWRASRDWGAKLGYDAASLAAINTACIDLMAALRRQYQTRTTPMVIDGCVGPRGDGYDAACVMTAVDAEVYHAPQIQTLGAAGVDMIGAITMTNVNEALGIAHAAQAAGLPVAISFTLETDGRLPTGQSLGDAITEIDAATNHGPAYYMINCAHPTHFEDTLDSSAPWHKRVRGLRANASKRSHAELNDAPDLDDGNPAELGTQYSDILKRHRHINVLGGCCGTDHRHVECIGVMCASQHSAIAAA